MALEATRHQREWIAAGILSAARDVGVELSVDYCRRVAADGLASCEQLAVTELGSGVIIHTAPEDEAALPIVLGFADSRGQWYRDGRRHLTAVAGDPAPSAPRAEVEL